jgi:multidrug efflux system membrane fusion protein
MNFPKLWIASPSAAALAVFGTYLWREGIPSSVMNPAANTPLARPVPVTAGVVKEQEFAISRVGLGTVQAYNTVTVKVRVDGQVQKIAFREGQDVKVGDVMAQIDPRP